MGSLPQGQGYTYKGQMLKSTFRVRDITFNHWKRFEKKLTTNNDHYEGMARTQQWGLYPQSQGHIKRQLLKSLYFVSAP